MINGIVDALIFLYQRTIKGEVLNIRYKRRDRRALKYARQLKIPQLSLREKEEINEYWKKYGIRFRDFSWFRRYYYVTGRKDPRYLPHPLLELIVYPYYNDLSKAEAWADKNAFPRHLPEMNYPATIAQRINSKTYDAEHHYYGTEINEAFTKAVYRRIKDRGLDSVIIKQTLDTNSGHGVRKYPISSPEDVREALLASDMHNFIIQEPIKQHPFFAQFNDTSVNVIRFNTWRNEDEVVIFSPCLRFGCSGSVTDVSYVDGVQIISAAGINKDGVVDDVYWTNRNEKKPLKIENKEVPMWQEMCRLVKGCHMYLDYFDIVAWDITIDYNNQIICVEYNLEEPGSIVYQYIHGPFLGDYTDEFLAFLRDPERQKRLIPRCIQFHRKSK